MGAHAVLDIYEHQPEERGQWVHQHSQSRGADVTIEASGNPLSVVEGLQMTRDNGIYVIVGQYTDAGDVTINPHLHINKKHLDIRGVWGIDYSHIYKSVHLMAKHSNRFQWQKMISKTYPLEKVKAALEAVKLLQVVKAVIAPSGNV